MKGNKGITLIALVITIIVLLILAGVSIAMLTGENSILKRASSADVGNVLGAANDAVSLYVSDETMAFYERFYVEKPTELAGKDFMTELNKYLASKVTPANLETAIGDSKIVASGTNSSITVNYKESEGTKTGVDNIVIQFDNGQDKRKSTGTFNNAKITWSITAVSGS